MNVWVTADLHFGHEAILNHCNRPFQNVEEMDEFLIERWNSLISKQEHVYIVGDFAFKDHAKYLNALNGRKHLIVGSHDAMNHECLSRFISVSTLKQIKYQNKFFVLSHCPLRTWNDCQRGNVHLFGHCHGRTKTYNLSFDIGVDTNNYLPYNMEEVMSNVRQREKEMEKVHRIIVNKDGTKQYYQDDVKYLEFLIEKMKG